MKKKRVFVSILLSYIVIMVTPMVILGIVLFNFFYSFYDNESLNNRMNTLHKMQITVDLMINEMNANAYSMFNSSEFSTTYLKYKYGNFLDVTRKLSSVVFTNNFIREAFYLNDELQQVFTAQTMYSYAQFQDYDSGYDVSEKYLTGLLLKNLRSYWLPVQKVGKGSKDALTYVVTNKIGAGTPKSSVFFQIYPDTLDKLTGEFVAGSESCVTICDYEGNLLYTSNPEISDFAWPVWKAYSGKKADVPIKMDIHGETFVIYLNNSTVSPIKYVSIIPYQSIIAPIRHYNMLFFIGVLVITVVCSFFIFYFMRINYVPIHSLSKLAASFFGEPQGDMGEFETTEKALKKISEHNFSLMCDKITLKLMRGGYDSLESFEEEGRRVGYRLSGPRFRVIGFNISSRNSKDNIPLDINRYHEMASFIENTLRVYVDACAVDYSEADTIYVVASGLDEELNELGIKLKQIKNVIENAFDVLVSIGVGNVARINEVMDSSSQATIASKYQLVKGRGSIVFYEDIGNKTATQFVYPNYAIDALYHAILFGEEERVQFAMETLIKYISDSNSLFFGTCLAYDILNATMKAMRELNYSFSSLNQSNLVKKGTLKSTDEIVQIVNMITDEIVHFISAKDNSSGESVVLSNFEQIMKYISEHYMEENFSVKSLADYFDMSISNFSHYFKKQTGQTVSDYISLLRFNKAKELLRTTDMNLQDIASMCGYLHLSTFMRQFKRHENITPSSYRAQYRY